MAGRSTKPSDNKAISAKRGNKGGCALLFFSIFFLGGGAFLYFIFIIPAYHVVRSMSWPETPCTVVSSKLDVSHDSDGSTYRIDIEFSYEVDGQKYTSLRYDFMPRNFHSSGRRGKQKVIDRYPPGKKTVCYVDPNDPQFAALHRGPPLGLLWGLIPGVMVLVGAGGLLGTLGVFKAPAKRPRRFGASLSSGQGDDSFTSTGAGSLGSDFALPPRSGPVTLKPDVSPLAKAVGVFIGGAIWNGIVSVFVTIVVNSHIKGRPEWLLTFFMIPFVLVGLFLIYAFFHSLLAVFNPRPVLTLGDSAVSLGETVSLDWRFNRISTSVRRLHIFLQAEERAKYRRGTRTYTDQETFLHLDIVDSTNFMDIASGAKQFTIPGDLMHTFKSNHNEVVWSLRVQGDIAWWPDVDDTYPVVVLPHDA